MHNSIHSQPTVRAVLYTVYNGCRTNNKASLITTILYWKFEWCSTNYVLVQSCSKRNKMWKASSISYKDPFFYDLSVYPKTTVSFVKNRICALNNKCTVYCILQWLKPSATFDKNVIRLSNEPIFRYQETHDGGRSTMWIIIRAHSTDGEVPCCCAPQHTSSNNNPIHVLYRI